MMCFISLYHYIMFLASLLWLISRKIFSSGNSWSGNLYQPELKTISKKKLKNLQLIWRNPLMTFLKKPFETFSKSTEKRERDKDPPYISEPEETATGDRSFCQFISAFWVCYKHWAKGRKQSRSISTVSISVRWGGKSDPTINCQKYMITIYFNYSPQVFTVANQDKHS